ncbi:MAG TPA: hypothetical protein VGR67_05595 [Candidatus Polarisedimenticolia bacterium]|jgi:hypothetical protein|nr:hypothetical protein [Candidatus Polarisedimenticolia bacterium]
MVLRITIGAGTRTRATLKLEGRVVAGWAPLLERECFRLLGSWDAVCLDLAGVTFVDRLGVETLQRLGRAGIEIRCPRGMVASVLEGEGIPLTADPQGN